MTCDWELPPSGVGCSVACQEDPTRWYGVDCNGPPNGPFSCTCQLNGRDIGDSLNHNVNQFEVNSCKESGQLLADGHCKQFLNCCYTFFDSIEQSLPKQTVCNCTSDPTYGGFSSCEALAASLPRGQVIDICPGYLPADGVGTPPGSQDQ